MIETPKQMISPRTRARHDQYSSCEVSTDGTAVACSRAPRLMHVFTCVWILILIPALVGIGGCEHAQKKTGDHGHQQIAETEKKAQAPSAPLEAFQQKFAGTSVVVDMVPIKGNDKVDPFYASSTEQTWDLYDVFIFNLDSIDGQSTPEADAVTRPSKPYVMTDRGYGHQGYALLSATPKAAEQFMEWLRVKTGRKYRLPTVAEFTCMLEGSKVDASNLQEFAWVEENADYTTQPVGSKPKDAQGLHDIWGNVSEYAVKPDGTYVVMGGSFIDPAKNVSIDYSVPFTTDWNKDDPQIPKSPWWMASNDWVGIRLVCDPE